MSDTQTNSVMATKLKGSKFFGKTLPRRQTFDPKSTTSTIQHEI